MAHKKFIGLTDSQVIESREKNGTNVITPKEEDSIWKKIKDCMHFWLLKLDLTLVILSVILAIGLPLTGIYAHDGLWIAPVLAFILFILTYLVAFLGGEWDDNANDGKGEFDMDALFTILLFALLLSCGISFYEGVFGTVQGLTPYFEPIGIAVAVLLATGVGYWLEAKNDKIFKSLNQVNDDTAVKVIRNGNVCQIPRKDVVVGDIVILEMGEEIPADARLLEATNLSVDESSLTGEPPVHKSVDAEYSKELAYPSNHIKKGCTITEGNCIAEVYAVGDKTDCGKVFEAAQVQEGEKTPLSEKLDDLAEKITVTSYVLAALIVVGRLIRYVFGLDINVTDFWICLVVSIVLALGLFIVLQKKKDDDNGETISIYQTLGFLLLPTIAIILMFSFEGIAVNWAELIHYCLNSIMIAVTLIVVAVPEGLPMAVNLSLAFSMKRLMDQKTLPRTMHSCETMGATTVICTDKTGTLTMNQMSVSEAYFAKKQSGELIDDEFSELIKEALAVNSTANLDFAKKDKIKSIGNPTEGALLLWLHKNGVNYLDVREDVEVLDRILFSTELKYMATIVRSNVNGKRILYVKGAPEIVMSFCSISQEEKDIYSEKLTGYQNKAMRTLGCAYKVLEETDDVITDGKLNIKDLEMMGVFAIADPVRPDVPDAIKECMAAGIQVKIVTGDTPGTAKEIGRQVGLWTDNDGEENILIGKDLAKMSDDELKERLKCVKIISRARPNDKERAVKLLKEMGEIVAVTGDGTNDAPALNAAHVGLSMGDGTAIAKEASDMTIMDNSFSTIANAVMWGRSLYKNIKRFILFQMTVNVTACVIVLVGAFVGTESPLTVTQMLWVNLIMDTFAALALASLPPTNKVMEEKPRPVNEHILVGIWKSILFVGLSFAVICFAFMLYFEHNEITSLLNMPLTYGVYDGLSGYELGLFFTIFVMLHFWYLFNSKAYMTTDSAFKEVSISKTPWFIVISVVIFFGQIALVEVPGLQEMFNVEPGGLKLWDWVIIVGISSVVMWIGEVKHLIKRIC